MLPDRASRKADQQYVWRSSRHHERRLAAESTLVNLGDTVLCVSFMDLESQDDGPERGY